jgi:vacuolar-type H+-ATPase subunit F/Vma7
MAAPYYVGDEVSAAGWRLAGAQVAVPEPGAEAAALAAARATAPLVVVSAAIAARIPEAQLRAALAALAPPTLIVPDLAGEAAVPDVAARLRRQLGLEG